MSIDDISEKQAQKILTMLASKHGKNPHLKSVLGTLMLIFSDKPCYIPYTHHGIFKYGVFYKDNDAKHCLKTCLDEVQKGNAILIDTSSKLNLIADVVFIPKFATLESILIECDLAIA